MIPELRCKSCNKKHGENFEGKVEWVCPRCETFNKLEVEVLTDKQIIAAIKCLDDAPVPMDDRMLKPKLTKKMAKQILALKGVAPDNILFPRKYNLISDYSLEVKDEQTRPHRTLQAREGQVLPKV